MHARLVVDYNHANTVRAAFLGIIPVMLRALATRGVCSSGHATARVCHALHVHTTIMQQHF